MRKGKTGHVRVCVVLLYRPYAEKKQNTEAQQEPPKVIVIKHLHGDEVSLLACAYEGNGPTVLTSSNLTQKAFTLH